jgi:hypothetical protein
MDACPHEGWSGDGSAHSSSSSSSSTVTLLFFAARERDAGLAELLGFAFFDAGAFLGAARYKSHPTSISMEGTKHKTSYATYLALLGGVLIRRFFSVVFVTRLDGIQVCSEVLLVFVLFNLRS